MNALLNLITYLHGPAFCVLLLRSWACKVVRQVAPDNVPFKTLVKNLCRPTYFCMENDHKSPNKCLIVVDEHFVILYKASK